MNKLKKQFICSNCGAVFSKWTGKCLECNSWDSVIEEIIEIKNKSLINNSIIPKVEKLEKIALNKIPRIKTEISEFDRAIGGGLVESSIILIGGEPGIGKSTLLLQISSQLSKNKKNIIYVSAEESAQQIKLRADRLNTSKEIPVLHSTNLENILSIIEENKNNADLKLVIIDSIQAIFSSQIGASAGSISQIKLCASIITNYAKNHNIAFIISCHVNKDGMLSGPKMLEHMVDTVLYFEGDHFSNSRIIRAIKNRFGSVNEVGVFYMLSEGLKEVKNPSEIFLMSQAKENISGNAILCTIEGSRALFAEIQVLIAKTTMNIPRRSVVGWDFNRLSMILAVLNIRLKMNLSFHEVYLNVVGGLKLEEPAADLAVAAALISAYKNKPISNNSVFFGEVGGTFFEFFLEVL
ncbi:MAG: DNA repair protein RadA [Rickettsia sp.]|nr:DNA repair protein RadA [Rickettsia sp.]